MSDAQFLAGTRSQTLGDAKAGISPDLDALAAYLSSLSQFEISPYRLQTGELTAEAVSGRAVFERQCLSCHGGSDFSDSGSLSTRNVGTLKAVSGQRLAAALSGLDTPTLRDVWASAPYLHDGSAATIEAAISAHTNLSLSSAELVQVAAFTRQIGREESAIAVLPPDGSGLSGQYFSNNSLSGVPVLTRVETVNFDWGTGAPAAGIPADNFSVRWTGQVQAASTGNYRFQTVSDDGVRLWVNGTLLINNWTAHTPTTDTSAEIQLVAGQRYDIRLEYQERTTGALIQLRWLPPAAGAYSFLPAQQLIPAGVGLTGHYFANNALTGAPALTRVEAVSFDWGTAAPGAGVPADNYSVRWTGRVTAPATGPYRLQTLSDDGVRLWVNGTLLINNWTAHAPTADTTPVMSWVAGQSYDITLEYNELTGGAAMQLLWSTPTVAAFSSIPAAQLSATGVGLRGSYFANSTLTGNPVQTRTEAVSFQWGTAAPFAGLPADNFSARWVGQVSAPSTGAYRFVTVSDEGVRLWINGALVVDNWTPHEPTIDTSAAISLIAGQRADIRLEYHELSAGATMQLLWWAPNTAGYVNVPASQLHGP